MKKFWPLGFLGFLGFYGISHLQEGNWLPALCTLCFGFFVFFLPEPKKAEKTQH